MIDFGLVNNAPNFIETDVADFIFQEVDVLFNTKPREVIGQPDFGTRYDKFLYNLTTSTQSIKQIVEDDLSKIYLFGFIPTVEVFLLEGTQNDILLIDIQLTRGGESYEKIYKIIE